MTEEPPIIGEKADRDPKTGRFLPNNNANPEGRPEGKLSWETEMNNAIERLAKENNTTPEEIKLRIYLAGYKGAKEGQYQFYKDFMDRKHGEAKKNLDIGVNEDLKILLSQVNSIFDDSIRKGK